MGVPSAEKYRGIVGKQAGGNDVGRGHGRSRCRQLTECNLILESAHNAREVGHKVCYIRKGQISGRRGQSDNQTVWKMAYVGIKNVLLPPSSCVIIGPNNGFDAMKLMASATPSSARPFRAPTISLVAVLWA